MVSKMKGFVFGVAAGLTLAGTVWAEEAATDLRERLQVIYDPVSREVTRRMVRIHDPNPGLALEFTWEPAAGNWPGVNAEGLATGRGVLSWRISGAPSYDPRAVHHSYDGTMKDGRFDGPGKLSFRDGSYFSGTWVAGVLHGQGQHLDAQGNRYEGAYVNGKAEGKGSLRSADGLVYVGGFRDGLRDGNGHVTEPGGLSYDVVMDAGSEVSSTRPVVYADSRIGGLQKAQDGGAAGKTDMTVIVDPRLGANQEVAYTHYAQNGEVLILPSEARWRQAWNGDGPIASQWEYAQMGPHEWLMNRAHTLFRLATTDGSRVKLASLDLAVEYSVPHLRPVLSTVEHFGCVSFRPDFHFVNYGWGQVENAAARVGFRNPDLVEWEERTTKAPDTPWFDVSVGDFDEGVDVSIRNALIEAGVDVATLENKRLTCPSADMLDSCRAKLVQDLGLSRLAGTQQGGASLSTDMIGELSYDWTDALGERHQETQVFAVNIRLGTIEVPGGLAECGDGGAFATQAPQYMDVDLPYDAAGYRINIPFRGNPNIQSLLSGLKFYSERSSMHLMQMEATFADGSIRRSPPVRLFMVHTRIPNFQSKMTPAVCTLPEDLESSC